jgi:PKD repeat protein
MLTAPVAATYTVTAQSPDLTSCTNTTSSVIVQSCSSGSTWIGSANGDWNTAANWSPAGVPNSCAATVTINSGTPVIGTTGGDISVGNITIGGGATLTLNGKNLNVCGTWTGGTSTNAAVVGTGTTYLNSTTGAQTLNGNTQFDILQINNSYGVSLASRANVSIATGLQLNTGQLDASTGTLTLLSTAANSNSYIDDFTSGFTPGTIKGNVIAQRYVPIGGRNQHFISSPLGGVGLGQVTATGTDGAYIIPTPTCDETVSASNSPYGSVFTYVDGHEPSGGCMLGNWRITTAGDMLPALGYSTYLTGNSTLSVTGSANTGNMQYTGYNSNYDAVNTQQGYPILSGWNLVGNPYPSAIDLTATRTGYDNQVQIWQTSGPFSGTWQQVTITGEHGAVVIPPFQAFMVHVTSNSSPGNYTYNFYQSERVRTDNVAFYRSQSQNMLTLKVNYNGTQDMSLVAFNPSASNAFDAQYDAVKPDGSQGRPTLYTYFNDQNIWYGINTLPSLTETAAVPVGLRPENTGSMAISAEGIESFDPTTYIYLEDKQTGTWANLRNGAYSFNTTTTDNQQRFVLHFTPPVQILTEDASCQSGGMINITQAGTANWSYALADANNTNISSGILNTSTPVNINAEPGVYTLTLTDNTGYTVVKSIQVGGTEVVSAAFSASQTTAAVQQNITFTGNSPDATVYNWNFGDGSTASGQTAVHSFQQQGIYNVVLNVSSAAGCTSSTTHTAVITSRSATGVSTVGGTGNIEIWSNENRVFIDFSKQNNVNADIEMYDVLGQLIDHETFGRSSLYSRELTNLDAAYVIVKVVNGNEVTTKKVFIINK